MWKYLFYLPLISFIFFTSCSVYDPVKVKTTIEVKEDTDVIEISPKVGPLSKTGFMFYPGAFVNAGAYVPMLSKLAEKGIRVLIIKAPIGLMVFEPEKGLKFRSRFEGIGAWLISGHSLGGAMAATAIKKNPSAFVGLVLLAAYPAEADDLRQWTGKVTSLSGSEDGLATPTKVDDAKKYLPSTTRYVQIKGGNHAQFGDYGNQNGDKPATISMDDQHKIVIEEILKFYE